MRTRTCVRWTAWLVLVSADASATMASVYPGATWDTKPPGEVGLDSAVLDQVRDYAGGRGCIVRYGYLVYTWGDVSEPGDVASAVKPWISHFLFKAVEEGRIPSLDAKAVTFEPRLGEINVGLDHKDRRITFRHLANQTACYGLRDEPGTAFVYNDWQMALFFDTLFCKVYGVAHKDIDNVVLHPMLTDILQCEDNLTFMAFGVEDRPGRLAVSPRDFARFGLLYLHKGAWNGRQLIRREHAEMAVASPLPNTIARSTAKGAEMIPGQRTLGSQVVPDNQCDHRGSYSWLWWVNGVDGTGARHWPNAPADTFATLGHGDMRGMAVLPGLEIIISWNDTQLDRKPLNEVFRLVGEAAADASG